MRNLSLCAHFLLTCHPRNEYASHGTGLFIMQELTTCLSGLNEAGSTSCSIGCGRSGGAAGEETMVSSPVQCCHIH